MHNRTGSAIFLLAVLISYLPSIASADSYLADHGIDPEYQSPLPATAWTEALQRGLERAINPDDFVCSAPTDLDYWVDAQFSQIDPMTLITLDALSTFFWAFDAKLLFDHDARDEYIGVDGEFSSRQNKTFKDQKRFWDVYSDDILLMGGHGAEIADDDLMQTFVSWAFGYPPQFVGDIILTAARSAIEGGVVDLQFFVPGFIFDSPGIPGGYDNPLLTLNARAFTGFGEEIFPGSGIIPDKIIMGDGLLAAFTGIGIGEREGPDHVLSHEFAHHVQAEIGAFEPGPPTPEKTRRTELMADAFAAYYASHARGNTFQAGRLADVASAAYESGDCAFGNPNHHGTHLQRLKAVWWGESVSDAARKQGFIHSSGYMLEIFDEALPVLIEPDAP